MADAPFVFVSYARRDSEVVGQIVDQLKKLGIRTWVDSAELVAGTSWVRAISDALQKAQALLFFISPASVQSKVVTHELDAALTKGVRVLPVLLEVTAVSELPPRLREIQWLDATGLPPETIAQRIARTLEQLRPSEAVPGTLDDLGREGLAKALVAQTKGAAPAPDDEGPNSVFLVHGHDEDLLQEVLEFVEGLGIKGVVLKDAGGAARSLLDKFFEIGSAARFAIVLISADDMGASRSQFEEPDVGPKALKYRSRQNAILELGYFYGRLGWDKVFVLEKAPPKRFPDFERPSDLNGVVFDRYDAAGKWKMTVARRLEDGGFVFEMSKPASTLT